MRGKAKVKTTQFLKTSLILVLTLSLATFTFLAFFMSHQSASNTTLSPNGTAIRFQAAAMLTRYCQTFLKMS